MSDRSLTRCVGSMYDFWFAVGRDVTGELWSVVEVLWWSVVFVVFLQGTLLKQLYI